MTHRDNNNAEFWRGLLEKGNDEPERINNWNKYLYTQYSQIKSIMPKRNNSRDGLIETTLITENDRTRVKEFSIINGPWPDWPQNILESFMNFSNMEIERNISLAGRVLIGADFRNTVFKGWADFRGAVFLGLTHFENARFKGNESIPQVGNGVVSFRDSVFCNSVYFKNTVFPHITRFDNAINKGNFNFQEVSFNIKEGFLAGAFFGNAIFESGADFSKTKFVINTTFENAGFKDRTSFKEAYFQKNAVFNNTTFENSISFRRATFRRPPEFFEARLHEDLNLNGIDWSKAERSYKPRHNDDAATAKIKERAEKAISAWEGLERIMTQLEKYEMKHVFFRLMKRAERYRDGWSITTIANLIYGFLSDYGWGIGRSLIWWFGQFIFFAFLLAETASIQANQKGIEWSVKITLNSFLVSFSNSLSFLRLGSAEGHLSDNFDALKLATNQMGSIFSTVGTIQAVVGPILLFMVLLTLRNRFRIG
ncbi:MAG: pentapeptide repeat-containing protein [Paracoccaceae bacterium]|nr:pentapeptide repeat-containing protein [Paracoccaceae bacterium]